MTSGDQDARYTKHYCDMNLFFPYRQNMSSESIEFPRFEKPCGNVIFPARNRTKPSDVYLFLRFIFNIRTKWNKLI